MLVRIISELEQVARQQSGVVTRAQVLHCGLSVAQLKGHLAVGRWQRIHRGVYATFSGPLPRLSALWAVVLRAGPGAMLSHETAAELAGLQQREAPYVHVTVPAGRCVTAIAGVVIHRSVRTARTRHPTRTPPQTRLEDTVLDLTQTSGRIEDAMSWLARAVGGRHTTAARLAERCDARPKLRWRADIRAALTDVASGCHSLLELTYLRLVERAHRLPASQRQVRREAVAQYDDVHYRQYATRVELDGRAAHPHHLRWRDMRRDNAAVVDGDRVLRYGTEDVTTRPCHVAVQVATVLAANGWRGTAVPCRRPGCVVARLPA